MLSSLTSVVTAAAESVPGLSPSSVSLRAALAQVPDPRKQRGVRYAFEDLLTVIVCAVVAGARSLTAIAEWAGHAATIRPVTTNGCAPSLATIHRVCAGVDGAALDTAVTGWIRGRTARRAIAIDGKEARGAKNGSGSRQFLMAALDHDTGCVIGQEAIGEKTNEIPHFPALMGQLGELKGTVITADALHTQREHATLLAERGAHYVFTVKDNQKALRDRIASQTWAPLTVQHARRETGHGRTTEWQITVQSAQTWIDFPHAAQTIRLTRDRHDHRTGEHTREQVYAITSLAPDEASPARLAALIRGHWGIENRLHWVRDVTYDEDRSQIRTRNAPRVMAAIRNLAISIHRLAGATNIAAALRHAARDPETARHLTGL